MELQSLSPLFDMVLVKQMGLVGVNQAAGILIEGTDNTVFQIVAQVVAVGPGSISGGRIIQCQIVPGQQVLCPPQSGLEVVLNGEKHILIKEIYLLGGCVATLSKAEQLAEELLSHPELAKEQKEDIERVQTEQIEETTTAPEVEEKPVISDAEKAIIENVAAQEGPTVARSADGERKFTMPLLSGSKLPHGEDKPLGQENENKPIEVDKELANSQGQTATPILKADSLKVAVKKNVTERKTGQSAQKDKVRINTNKKKK